MWSRIRGCAEQLAGGTGAQISVGFTTTYSAEEGTWLVEALSKVAALSFGTWQVMDPSGAVSPRDEVAQSIDPTFPISAAWVRRNPVRVLPI